MGIDARNVKDVPVGSLLEVCGRFQSRDYEKKDEDTGLYRMRTAYEVSVSKVVMEAE